MRKVSMLIIVAVFIAAFIPGISMAGPDMYSGDTSMFGGSAVVLPPNVLIILDSSQSMSDDAPVSGDPYDPSVTYPATNHCNNGSGNNNNQACTKAAVYYQNGLFLSSDSAISDNCQGGTPQTALRTVGQSIGIRLNSDGSCRTQGGSRTYQMGNFINWTYLPAPATQSKLTVAKTVVANLITATNGVKMGLMKYGAGAEGAQFLSSTVSSSTYITTPKLINDDTSVSGAMFTGTTSNKTALKAVVASFTTSGSTPLGESLVEALRFFQGAASDFGNTVGISGGHYTSPITWGCQKNYIIFVTDGMSTADGNTTKLQFINTRYGRYDGGCASPYSCSTAGDEASSMAGAAKYLYESDLSTGFTGSQNVTTYTIGFGLAGADAEAINLLKLTADSQHGRGNYYDAGSESELTSALTSIMGEIFAVNTSYVAPVVPVSPDNRTSSGNMVYMGFFKPVSGKPWVGNLKKYGLDLTNNAILDRNLVVATNADGSFKSTASSYWNTSTDGPEVDAGGVGEKLIERTTARNIYTATPIGNPTALAPFSSSTVTAGALYLSGSLSTDSTNAGRLINFIKGIDAFDDNGNGNTTENREWMLGDILHSKPAIVRYSSSSTVVYVGSNDGMLHAFNDSDGSEAWAFIPPDMIKNLQYLHPASGSGDHAYFVDSSPMIYKYDANNDGIVNGSDKVILMFGERRGGGSDTSPSTGYYYALDITDPATPTYLWRIGGNATGYTMLAETWSEPKLVKMKDEVGDGMIAAIFGAGYDNLNEDGRYGNTQLFDGTGVVDTLQLGIGSITSLATSSTGTHSRGHGVYVLKIASLDATGVPTLLTSPTIVHAFSTTTYSVPSEVAALDVNGDSYVDTAYVGDTGGNIWRLSMPGSTSAWSATQIFSLNSGGGRKIFYKPSVYSDVTGTAKILIGTGDREHPLNLNVGDKIYGLKDRGQTTSAAASTLFDVTLDTLQTTTITATQRAAIISTLTTTNGWYINLESAGEKNLSAPLLFNGVGYFTTWAPSTGVVVDPCSTGNLGNGSLYAVNSQTGEAVLDYNNSGGDLVKADRKKSLPPGIPSQPVMLIDPSGKGVVLTWPELSTATPGGTFFSIYWRSW